MTGWAPRRFWTDVGVTPTADGFSVTLDGRPIRTPAKAALCLPTRALAAAIAAEWHDQDETIRPDTMPLTRASNTAIDRMPRQRGAVAAELLRWGETDLLCYRAETPDALAERQRAGWDPMLDWAARELGARMAVTAGVVPCAQPAGALAALRAELDAQDDFALTALSELVALSGSLILALAVRHGHAAPDTAWTLSRIDEDWQQALWGTDAEAARQAADRRAAFLRAHRFLALSRPGADDPSASCA